MRSDTTDVQSLDAFDTIIDVRSPAEFALDHIPGALNYPVLNDEERAKVGTIYKQQSPFLAKKIGAALVARNIATHLEHSLVRHERNWRPLVYCWRGGKRSGAMTTVLRNIGWDARQLEGGYKAFRRSVVADIDAHSQRLTFIAVCGMTGSGKSRLLAALAREGAQVLDLETLAAHRGSVLGRLPNLPQPAQKKFESLLWQALRRLDPTKPVFVESESKKIGDVYVPESLIERMWASECLRVDTERSARVQLLLGEYAHFLERADTLREPLEALTPLHGRKRIAEWLQLMERREFSSLVMQLLELHYDPAYLRSIGNHYARYKTARVVRIADADSTTFEHAAKQLVNDIRAAA